MKTLVTILAVVMMILAVSGVVQAADINMTFDTAPVVGPTQAADTWYTDRYAPAGFTNELFAGDYRLKQSVSSADSAANRPSAYSSTFYNTQGRKYDTSVTGTVQSFSIDLYVASDWGSNNRSAGLWATGFDGTNAVSAYPILAFRNIDNFSGTTATAGIYGWDYAGTGGYFANTPVTEFGKWYNLKFVLTVGTGIQYFVNDAFLGSVADVDTTSLGNVILNTYNFGSDYDVYWDNFTATAVPEPATMALLGLGGLLFARKKK